MQPEPSEQQAEVVAGGGEHGVDRVADAAGEAIAFDQAVALEMADHRLDRVAPTQLAPDRGGDTKRPRV